MAPAKAKTVAAPAALPEIEPTHLVVRALVNGFRRAGRAWRAEETTVPIGEFSAAQVEALMSEPNLVVTPMVAVEAE